MICARTAIGPSVAAVCIGVSPLMMNLLQLAPIQYWGVPYNTTNNGGEPYNTSNIGGAPYNTC
jgi:hypothetical protein